MTELGLESGSVRVVPYEDAWPVLYTAEAERLTATLTDVGLSVVLEHTGSTAVPGLAAKPIIDILGGLTNEDDRWPAIRTITGAGYVHRGEQEIPGRDFLRLGDPRRFHLHLTRLGSTFWQDHRDFRDWLRSHPDAVTEYMSLKRRLAAEFHSDREGYILGKTSFVQAILRAARSQ